MRIPGSLSLSLSLSLLHWRREQEERSGGVGPWSGPTTPAVTSNHPGCHLQPPGLPYRFDVYPPDADQVASRGYMSNATPARHPIPHCSRRHRANGYFSFFFFWPYQQRFRDRPPTTGPPDRQENTHPFCHRHAHRYIQINSV